MTADFTIRAAAAQADFADAARLFRAYADALPVDLSYQDFASELAGLPGKYAGPRGAILLARDPAGVATGCVGIRPLPDTGCCEMKRLFTLPVARGTGLGVALARAAIGFARDSGYAELRLDTLSGMTAAITLYRRLGFVPCAPYYAPTPPGTIFLALKL